MYEKYRVLFVDDEPNILSSIRRSLMDEEYFCHFANSGAEALEILKSYNIAVIITDMRMPEMTGLELLKHVKELYPMIVKVVLSGYTQLPQILATINQVDIFKFITKPWDVEDLIRTIRKSIDYYIMKEENANYRKSIEAKNIAYQNILKKINELINEEKSCKLLIGIVGEALIEFVSELNVDDKVELGRNKTCSKELLETLIEQATSQRKEMESDVLISDFIEHAKTLAPICNHDLKEGSHLRLLVNIEMIKLVIKLLSIIFCEEFLSSAVYYKIKVQEFIAITIIIVDSEEDAFNDTNSMRKGFETKISLSKSVLAPILRFCNINFHFLQNEHSMLVNLQVGESEANNREKNIDC